MNMLILLGILVSFTSFTVAWFSNIRNAQTHLKNIEVSAPDFFITEYNVYPVSSMTKNATTSSFTLLNTEATEMPKYDPNNIAYSPYERALVVHITFEYTGTESAPFGAKTSNETFTTGTPGENAYDESFTSNIFQFTPSAGVTLNGGWDEATLSVNNADSTTLVELNPSPTKSTNTTISTINVGSDSLWFVIEYNENVMQYINAVRATEIKEVVYEDDIIYYIGEKANA